MRQPLYIRKPRLADLSDRAWFRSIRTGPGVFNKTPLRAKLHAPQGLQLPGTFSRPGQEMAALNYFHRLGHQIESARQAKLGPYPQVAFSDAVLLLNLLPHRAGQWPFSGP